VKQTVGLLPFGVLVLLTACATSNPYPITLTGDTMVDGPNAIQKGPPRDKVLWQYRTAATALRRGLYDEAALYFDAALDRVEGIFSIDKDSKDARRLFDAEAKKTFLGEPYERVMAYYYRGLLYWMVGDLGNARACYKSAQIQDADTEKNEYAADYVLLDYLEGYINLKTGSATQQEYERAVTSARLAKPPPYNPNANVFLFVDYGEGPRKIATGQYREKLQFAGGTSPVRSARVLVDSTSTTAPPYDDLYFQATTRGGRAMDHILANKAVFKSTTSAVGDAAIISGAVLSTQSRNNEIGLGLLAAGLISKAISAGTTPQADTRYWENLPLFISFSALELPPGPQTVQVEFLDAANNVLPKLTKTIEINVAPDRDTVLYVSDKSLVPQNL